MTKINYEKIYNDLMLRSLNRTFVSGVHEKHHILPKCMGGCDHKSNIAILTYREHFIAHWLLIKFTQGDFLRKMLHAINRLTSKSKFHKNKIVSSWQYELSKKLKSHAMIGNKYSKGHKHSEEARMKMSRAWENRDPVSIETREKQSISKIGNKNGRGNKGKSKKEEWKIKMSGGGNGRARKVMCVNDKNIFSCINNAAKFYQICRNSITKVCKEKQAETKGYVFKYME